MDSIITMIQNLEAKITMKEKLENLKINDIFMINNETGKNNK